ncbi:glycogen debranching enzyme [Candidatus Competibacter denitrificans Run_A_D11]|uniref:Glycogen debranching enzyme n=1 Tax=Candidatus Competibacter denitrificans Run_A_D11 TaxID=1400863 RepID=W6M6U5_9GAMM|nr:glycogen debranching protein GlgX [Candidatus Competibacter denitrificans]CDI02354.1 glycogen debranching enzyme [Candidatus Competibacter denitrificans Run_A_D11]HRC69659.1 glycogen debranching protein GlgX [Candidatus Competibacter denitrificans]
MKKLTTAVLMGWPYPLGATWDGEGVNFALFSEHAEQVVLCLFDAKGKHEVEQIPLREQTCGVWHGYLSDARPGLLYGYRVHGPYKPELGHRFNPHKLLLDPCAKRIVGQPHWSEAQFGYKVGNRHEDLSFSTRNSAPGMPKCQVVDTAFLWGDDRPPYTPWHDTIIYELHVRGFTLLHPEIPPHMRGTYAGLASEPAIHYLKSLGVTAVELLPVHYFVDERHLIDKKLHNYWGYSPIGYFAPDPRYAATENPVSEFKSMVKTLHSAGIEVLLDVVYNHTAEGNHLGPTLCFRGIDNAVYYRLSPEHPRYTMDYTGCGNTLNTSHPRVIQLVMDSLRYWVQEMHVDGFRFDLAAALARESHGDVDQMGSFMDVMQQDPVLARVKLIAEPWDTGHGGYQVGQFPVTVSEWNGKYRDVVRDYWRGEGGLIGDLAYRLTGSADLYQHNGRRPQASINFITAHDGFTLYDLVSYNHRHNQANLENNQDGDPHNQSWNCGVEGETTDPAIMALRSRQRRNFLATLLLSQGIPMLLAGDEAGRTQKGNNNAYCQDSEISWFNWDLIWLDDNRQLFMFVQRLVQLRREHPTFRRRHFFRGIHGSGVRDILWFNPDGREINDDEWDHDYARCLGLYLPGDGLGDWDRRGHPLQDDDFLMLFNAHHEEIPFVLPIVRGEAFFEVMIDTALPHGYPTNDNQHPAEEPYPVGGRSLVLLRHSRHLDPFTATEPDGDSSVLQASI